MKADELSFYLEGTNGKGVLLIHGLTGAPAEMKLVARHLNRKGYSVYAPLLAGHGVDAGTLRRSRWEDWLESVVQASSMLAERAQEVFAAGICVGGKLSMLAAERQPETIRAVAIYSPCFHYDGWDVPFYYPLLSSQISWLSRIPFLDRLNFRETASLGIKDERMRRLIGNMAGEGVLETFPGKGLVEMHRLGKTLRGRLPQMKTPTLILHAEDDDLSSPKHARYISDHIGGPHELRWIKDSYHMIHVDRQHRQVADFTADFFEASHAQALA
ncbi:MULTISPECIES: alpha/beta hydrolase [Rhizobium]|uniref:Carboxylesterase n=1 Tax=Rhizobium rhizogenes (strain K84 / ATCC BAA-868) TaxID=311403 RepID=B9JD67_RHIR8|nr:alpha/beta fold hydrolase [Rhizobium sp. AP16]ACM28196.1 carboxylesterase [Rhizobium rhizogenes K84]EJK83767.1 esterase/lipase [Rhizobium sp. AP16]